MSIFSPAPHIERLPEAQIDSTYKRLRREVFAGTFIGYATFYLIRQNFSLAVPYMIRLHQSGSRYSYDHLIRSLRCK